MLRCLSGAVLATLIFTHSANAIEEPKYRIVQKFRDFEIRRYVPFVVAEIVVRQSFANASTEGFRRLFQYISGENRARASIPMAAPVIQTAQPIDMAGPTIQLSEPSNYLVQFVMPTRLTLATLPAPSDRLILLRQVDATTFAAIRYSGTWSGENYAQNLRVLTASMHREKLEAAGTPLWARYDPPFVPWFLRRNEILIPVSAK